MTRSEARFLIGGLLGGSSLGYAVGAMPAIYLCLAASVGYLVVETITRDRGL